jgi:hypothetical protein
MARLSRFNKKAFVSLLTTVIWIIISLTGIVLYFTPPGRIAHYVYWTFLGLSKEQWQTIHTIFSFSFVITAIFHLYFNWTVFWSYIKSKVVAGIKLKRELSWAVVLSAVLLVISIVDFPPASTVMNFGEAMKNSWGDTDAEPPVPHAERLTLKELSTMTQSNLNGMMKKLKDLGYTNIDSSTIIEQIAQLNNVTPQKMVTSIMPSGQKSSGTHLTQRFGFGKKTVEQICNENNIKLSTVKDRLETFNIEFKDFEDIRTIADRTEFKPYDIVEIIRGNNNRIGKIH